MLLFQRHLLDTLEMPPHNLDQDQKTQNKNYSKIQETDAVGLSNTDEIAFSISKF